MLAYLERSINYFDTINHYCSAIPSYLDYGSQSANLENTEPQWGDIRTVDILWKMFKDKVGIGNVGEGGGGEMPDLWGDAVVGDNLFSWGGGCLALPGYPNNQRNKQNIYSYGDGEIVKDLTRQDKAHHIILYGFQSFVVHICTVFLYFWPHTVLQ